MFGIELSQLAFLFMIAVAVGGIMFAILYPFLISDGANKKRVKAIADTGRTQTKASGLRARLLAEDPKDNRRKQLQESLNQIEEQEKQRKKRLTLRVLIAQSGLDLSPRMFYLFSIIFGLVLGAGIFIAGLPWYIAVIGGIAAALGLPRWVL
ncbi:MAG: hypothetical protein AB7F76_05730, partial [Parvibaculaceae bacterium]